MEIEGRYRPVRRLGAGGTGTVYAAADTLLGRTVALKILHGTIDSNLLRREAQSLARLHHPNVVVLHDLIEHAGTPGLVMEYVEGTDLGAWLEEQGAPGVERGLSLFAPIARAVAHAHGMGVLHCDIKPSNVLLSMTGEVKLTDFTLARLLAAGRYHGPDGGSLDYAAPEQLSSGPMDERTDVYALGVLLRRLVGTAHEGPEDRAPVDEVITRATQPEPEDRFPSVVQMLDALPLPEDVTRVVPQSRSSDLTRVLPRPTRAPKRTTLAGKLALGIALVGAASAAVFTGFTVWASPAHVTLPDLVATNASSARLVARSLDLQARIERVYSSAAPAGTVIAQTPRGGSTVDEHGSVTLIVSRGPKPIVVPAVSHMAQADAVSKLQSLGFKVEVHTEDTVFQDAGQVLHQSPDANAQRLPGSTITITVSTKPWWWVF